MLVAGASGFAGALAAHLSGATRFELAAVTARRRRPAPEELYPHHRVPLALEELDLDRPLADVDAAIVAYPHGAAAPAVAALRERGVRVVDLCADFRLRALATLRALVRPAPAPGADRRRPSTG